MRYRINRKTGDRISEIGIGTAYIYEAGTDEAVKALRRAYEGGINYFDLAAGHGDAFPIFGEAFEDIRENIFYQIHFGADYSSGDYGWSLNLDTVKKSVAKMLKELRTDYIDYGFIHCQDEIADWETYLKNGICTVYMNSRVNWDFVLSFYTIIPKWAFKLKNNAYTLVRYIFYLARQNTEAIKEKGYFTISIRAVCAELNLPDMEETKNPGRDIINVIEDATSEIEQENNDSDFTITPVNFDVDTPARERLTNGYLKIGLKGKYHFFIDIAKAEEQQIAAYKRRQERIKEQATIKALAEKSKDDTPETKE